jgi:hypothetical protein
MTNEEAVEEMITSLDDQTLEIRRPEARKGPEVNRETTRVKNVVSTNDLETERGIVIVIETETATATEIEAQGTER